MEEIESFIEVFFAGIVIVISMIASARKAKNRRIADSARQSRAAEEPAFQPALRQEPPPPAVLPVFEDIPGQVITPTVHTHMTPDCDTHDASGSLGYASPEGKDPCHEPQLTHTRTPEETAPEQDGLTFDWTGGSMVKAFVMQEVLMRPAQRRAR